MLSADRTMRFLIALGGFLLLSLFVQSATAQVSTSHCAKYFHEDRVPTNLVEVMDRFGDQAARICLSADGSISSYYAIYAVASRPHRICAFEVQKRQLTKADRDLAAKRPEIFRLNEYKQVARRCPRQDDLHYAIVYDVPDKLFVQFWDFSARLVASPPYAELVLRHSNPAKVPGAPACAELLNEIMQRSAGSLRLTSIEQNTHREAWRGGYLASLNAGQLQSWQMEIDVSAGGPKVLSCQRFQV